MEYFGLPFFLNTLTAVASAIVWFSLPGILILRLLCIRLKFHTVLAVPALGMCSFGVFSLFFCFIVSYSLTSLILGWITFIGLLLFSLKYYKNELVIEPHTKGQVQGGLWLYLVILTGVAAWALIPATTVYPFTKHDTVFINHMIFDHVKVALLDAIAREGLLPKDPFYAPEGERILLVYYYLWYFLASQIKLLNNISGWEADVACTYFTAFATISFLSFVAINITKQARTAIFIVLFALCGMLNSILTYLPPPHREYFLPLKEAHVGAFWFQASWAPQHVFAGLSVILLIFLLARILSNVNRAIPHAVLLGLIVATGFSTSVWIGGVGLLLAFPLILLAILSLRLSASEYLTLTRFALVSLGICVMVSIPVLISLISAPNSAGESQWPFIFRVQPTLNDYEMEGWGLLANVFAFWIKTLPVTLGIVYVAGIFTLLMRSKQDENQEEKAFFALSLAVVVGYLLIAQLTKSVIWNNDLGWRAYFPPILLLTLWSAVALTEFTDSASPVLSHKWRFREKLTGWKQGLTYCIVAGLTLGILASLRIFYIPGPDNARLSEAGVEQRQAFFRQPEIWRKVREYSQPEELVQANPDAYPLITFKAAMVPYSLLADRATSVLNTDYSRVFSHAYEHRQRKRQYEQVRTVFSNTPTKASLRYLRDTLHIKVLLVEKYDEVWQVAAELDNSAIYEIVYAESDYKIYRAVVDNN